jgi:hypothetical protein
MEAQFIQADIFDCSKLSEWNGAMDVVLACQFLHLFDWAGQVTVMKRIVEFTKGPGALVVGYQRAREVTERNVKWPRGMMFVHGLGTWPEIRVEVEKVTGTKWRVETSLVDLKEWGYEKGDAAWMDQYPMGINFVATRLK